MRAGIWAVACAVSCLSIGARAATGNVTTFAGGGSGGSIASSTPLSGPYDGAFDSAGNFYFTEPNGHRIRRVSTAGIITTIAGTGAQGNTGDGGSALQATLDVPHRIAVDGVGNVYFSDVGDHRVRKVDTAGIITVVAGNGTAGFTGDGGPATAASLNTPEGIAVDDAGSVYIADKSNFRVRKVSGGIITTIAGVGLQQCFTGSPPTPLPNGDGGPANAAYVQPAGPLILDGAGGYFVGDACGTVRHVDSSGIVRRYAGSDALGTAVSTSTTPIDALSANLIPPVGLSRDAAGNLYVGSMGFVAKVTPAGLATRFAGTFGFGDFGDGGPATSALLGFTSGVVAAPTGDVLIFATDFDRIRKVDLSGTISHYAGVRAGTPTGDVGIGDGGPATAAIVPRPAGLARDVAGNVYIADQERIRRVDPSGTISTVVGGGLLGADGVLATNTFGAAIGGVTVDASGNLYYSERDRSCVRKVNGSGIVTTIAGSCASAGFSGDGGAATAARLSGPDALAFDAAGNLYIADVGNKRVRKVDGAGNITTVAGSGVFGTFGDGSLATSAAVVPADIAIDSAGNLFIADDLAHRVRKVDMAGIITTVAGSGVSGGFSGDGGPATSATMQMPRGVAVDADGNVYVGDFGNNRIRMIGVDGVITTVAGTGNSRTFLDGIPASSADLFTPGRMMIGPGGALLVSEQNFGRVRRIEVIDTTPDAFAFTPRTDVALSAAQQSNAITPAGFTGSTSIAVANGEYSIGCDGTFVSTAATLSAGQSVCVRHTSSSRNNDTVTTTLSIGGRVGTFQTTTAVGPGSIALSAPAIDFGAQSMNTTAPAQTVTLTNSGSVAVTVNSVSATAGFGVTHDCGTLAPAATCTVTITFTPGTTGTIAATLTLQNSPGTQTVSVQGFGERSLTTHYYRSILRRTPDVSGKAFWESEAMRMSGLGANVNETWFSMANAFFFSPEYVAFNRSDTEYLVDLYNTFFNRPPDPSGSAFWGSQLSQGLPREVVLVSFMLSPEFKSFTQAIFGSTAARAEVDVVMDFYRGVLSRLPDQDGFTFWVQKLRTAQCAASPAFATSQIITQVDAISSQFLNSTEYVGRNRTNGQYVGDLYNAFLRRGGDLGGVQYWISQIATGARTRENVRQQFVASPEFSARVAAIIAQGCAS